MLMWHLFMRLISLFASLAERGPQQQACRDDAGAGPGRLGAPAGFVAAGGDVGADCRGDGGAPDAGRRVAVSAAVAAAGGTPAIDGATQEDCIRNEGGIRAVCGRPPRGRRQLAANLAAMGRTVSALDHGRRVLQVRFAKMELRARVELRRFDSDIETLADCCRFLAHTSRGL
jgi:hypothetical protein